MRVFSFALLQVAVAFSLAGCGSAMNSTATRAVPGAAASTNGSLLVTLSPTAAVTAGARWTLDSQTTLRTGGTTLTGLAPGSHTVHFTAVTGYVAPAVQTVTVTAGGTAAVSGTYTGIGSLRVTLAPTAAVTAGARWTLDSQTTLRTSGTTLSGLAAGSHTVHFTAVTGYAAPAAVAVVVTAGGTVSITGTYTAIGSVKVTLLPAAAITAGVHWTLDADTTLRASGATVSGLAVGSHTVHFVAANGWAAPANQVVTVTIGGTTAATGTFTAVGSIKVSLAPAAAVTAGAKWTLDTSTTQRVSGTIVTGVPVGSHTLHFAAVAGWTAPASQVVTVTVGGTAAVTGTYTVPPISFASKVAPLAAACTCHGGAMADRVGLINGGLVVPGNAAASLYVTKTTMQGYWGSTANRQVVVDWITQGANP